MKDTIIIGYSGHAFVIADAIFSLGETVAGYCDSHEKVENPFGLKYLGTETKDLLDQSNWVIGVGDNKLRAAIYEKYKNYGVSKTIVHPRATVGSQVQLGKCVFLASGAIVNPLASIGIGTILNSGCIVEHECSIGDFSHIAPGAVLAGNVAVGSHSFIGANAVVKQGIKIGNNVTVGAGSVIIRDIEDNTIIVGNPGRQIN